MTRKDEEIDYRPEGRDDGHPKKSSTDEGYDEAAHSGKSSYGVSEGSGGVFGTTGGGTYSEGLHPTEIPPPNEPANSDSSRAGRKKPATKHK